LKQKILLFSLMILCVCFVFPQETGKFGFFFEAGSSYSVGLTFNLSARVTLRPSFGFHTIKAQDEGNTLDRDEKENGYSLDLGLFYHFLKKSHFTAYSGLEVGYSHITGDYNVCYSEICGTREQTENGHSGNLILGFQYNFNKHLAVFGEIGFGFSKYNVDYQDMLTQGTYKYTNWSLSRSGFGIILYL
jgi:long-subunit fatty acid transport protein